LVAHPDLSDFDGGISAFRLTASHASITVGHMSRIGIRAARWAVTLGLVGSAACGFGLANAPAAVAATCPPGQTTGCTSVGSGNGAAAPTADLSASCGTGISAVLSNINGDQPVTFRVTPPAGAAEDVTVAADKIVRRVYPVAAGVRQPLTVSAPGMATATKSLPATCKAAAATHVLGEKVTRKPTRTVATAPRLPFTGPGFPAGPGLALGLGLVLAGGVLVRVSARPAR
jgi:hypothetical protein